MSNTHISVVHVGMILPDLISVRLRDGYVLPGRGEPYRPQAKDVIKSTPDMQKWLTRDGEYIGSLCGTGRDILFVNEQAIRTDLIALGLDDVETYRIGSTGDQAYATAAHPIFVARKSKPCDMARTGPMAFEPVMEHTIYLRLPHPLQSGRDYALTFGDLGIDEQGFVASSGLLRSEAIHTTQIGFRPDDPVKIAFLSCWMGSAGGVDFSRQRTFSLIDDGSGNQVFNGPITLARGQDEPEDGRGRNYNQSDVYEMDFSAWTAPGVYRIEVPGVGCSYPVSIKEDVWEKAFRESARSFYHQRSGMALTQPYTDFERPRGFHPADGTTVYVSTTSLMDSGNGLNRQDSNFGNLVAGKTDETLDNAWGAYFDAGDWDRRIQHLVAARYQLELVDLFADYFSDLSLNIPESDRPGPDLVHEALYNIDGYRRMQTANGGIRGGIESEEHPLHGETSWTDSLTAIAYAPDPWSSALYAAATAAAARVLQSLRLEQACVYRDSATRAMEWSTQALARGEGEAYGEHIAAARMLAGAELYRLTGEQRWQGIFGDVITLNTDDRRSTALRQDAAFSYLRVNHPNQSSTLKALCEELILTHADTLLTAGAQTGFHWVKPTMAHAGHGILGAPIFTPTLCRAHAITGDPKYLRAAVLSCQNALGANPSNLCYTTGVGYESVEHPMHVDSRITGRKPPRGLTVFGPCDIETDSMLWGRWAHEVIAPMCDPISSEWPVTESYWDVYWNPPVCEFTTYQTLAQNAYVWGYLAARGRLT